MMSQALDSFCWLLGKESTNAAYLLMDLLAIDAILLVRGVVNWKSVTLLELTLEHLLVLDIEDVDGSSSITTYKSSDRQHDNPEDSDSDDEN